jgi:tripartite-type tricarboxylate transporter receptor subunit TctC
MSRIYTRVLAAACAIASLSAASASAQSNAAAGYPARPVRWIVPFTPGASNDIIARLVGQKLTEALGQQFVIDNRPGAGGAVGAETVAKAIPDGYTLLLANPGPSVNTPLMLRKPLYAVEDFTNIVFIGYAPLLILANPKFPPNNAKELLAYAKSNPGKVSWGSSGNGSSLHIGLALFQAATGVDVVHVPYKGSAPALTDTVSGQIQVMHTTTVSADAQIKSNRVKVLGIASTKRSPLLPNVPTLAESGIKDAEAIVWFGMSGPPKLPRAIVAKLNDQVNKILVLPDVKQRLDQLGLEVAGGKPEEFDAFVRKEAEKVRRLIKAGLLKTD